MRVFGFSQLTFNSREYSAKRLWGDRKRNHAGVWGYFTADDDDRKGAGRRGPDRRLPYYHRADRNFYRRNGRTTNARRQYAGMSEL